MKPRQGKGPKHPKPKATKSEISAAKAKSRLSKAKKSVKDTDRAQESARRYAVKDQIAKAKKREHSPFIKSAVLPEQWPRADKPEIAVTGRSNAGKSTFLNAVTGSQIAKVSQKPGKTTLLNFFNIGKHYRFVDMPGYGYSSRSGSEQQSWKNMIEPYLLNREALCGVILIVDGRRNWTQDEQLLVRFLEECGKPWALVVSKIDKLNAKELRECRLRFQDVEGSDAVFFYSALERESAKAVEDSLFEKWVKGK